MVEEAPDRVNDELAEPASANASGRARSNEPAPLLGVSRIPELREVSLWVSLKLWLRGAPRQRQVNLPRPSRSVLAARTPTIIDAEDERRGEQRGRISRRS